MQLYLEGGRFNLIFFPNKCHKRIILVTVGVDGPLISWGGGRGGLQPAFYRTQI